MLINNYVSEHFTFYYKSGITLKSKGLLLVVSRIWFKIFSLMALDKRPSIH